MITKEELDELFKTELEVDDVAKKLKDTLYDLSNSDALSEEERKRVRTIFVSLDTNLHIYKKAMTGQRLGTPGAAGEYKEAEFNLSNINMEAKEVIVNIIIRQKMSTKPTSIPIPTIQPDSKTIEDLLDKIKQNPNDDTAYDNLGKYYFSIGQYDEAIKQEKLAFSKNPKQYIYCSNIGDAYRLLQNWDESIKWYKKAFDLESRDDILNNSLGIAYYSKGQNDKALEYYLKAITVRPQAVYFVNAGDASIKLNNLDAAIEYYNTAISLDSKYADAHGGFALAKLAKCRLENACDKNTINDVISHFEKAVELTPDNYFNYAGLGDAYYEIESWDDSIKNYTKAIELNRNDDVTYNVLGKVYSRKGQLEEAIIYYEKALQVNPKSFIYLGNIGDAYRNLGKWDEAVEYYNKALNIKPDDDIILNNLGLVYYSKGEYEKAIEYYNKAINVNSNEYIYYCNLGEAYARLNKWDFAINSFRKAVDLNPNDERSFSNLGYAYFYRAYFQQAIEQFKKAISIDSTNPINYSNLSFVYSKLKDWEQAKIYAETADKMARDINPKDDSYLIALSRVYNDHGLELYDTGNYEQAIEEYNEANNLKENHVYHWNLYLSYYKLGNYEEAKKHIIRAIDLKPDSLSLAKYLQARRDPKLL